MSSFSSRKYIKYVPAGDSEIHINPNISKDFIIHRLQFEIYGVSDGRPAVEIWCHVGADKHHYLIHRCTIDDENFLCVVPIANPLPLEKKSKLHLDLSNIGRETEIAIYMALEIM